MLTAGRRIWDKKEFLLKIASKRVCGLFCVHTLEQIKYHTDTVQNERNPGTN